MKLMSKFVLGAIFLSSAAFNANATVYRFTFSNTSTEYVQAGSGGVTNPTSIFAYVDYDTDLNRFRAYDNTSYTYLTYDGSDNNALGISGIAFNFGSTVPNAGNVTYPTTNVPYDSGSWLNLSSSTVPTVLSNDGFDRAYTTSRRLTDGESETFQISTFDSTVFSNLVSSNGNVLASSVAVAVSNNRGGENSRISWFTASSVAAVPEPESYAMFLAGLGLLGFVSRRKLTA